ncbi:hypothetical protein Pd630_LPD04272 [Rhodococcus opacus PD630]|nr:hypothetical protein Pd630_LPD04272 [Rhodococcus opacus PD630]
MQCGVDAGAARDLSSCRRIRGELEARDLPIADGAGLWSRS